MSSTRSAAGLRQTFRSSDIVFNLSTQLKPKPPLSSITSPSENPTDHMFTVLWNQEAGWGIPEIKPYAPLQIDPSASVLQFANTCFEALKAHKTKSGRILTFRPMLNMERFTESCSSLLLPGFDSHELLRCMEQLLKVEADWISSEKGTYCYVRPTAIATQPSLDTSPNSATNEALLYIILSAVGPRAVINEKPIAVYCDTESRRSFPGGFGDKHIGSNYGLNVL
jgi:branched-subunit amino acid aminotransferase/4-amino-4-deoxychorismate lyase